MRHGGRQQPEGAEGGGDGDQPQRGAQADRRTEEAAGQRAPHRLTRYAEDLAAAFHRFYGECRVLTDDHALSSARWWLVNSTKRVLANTLALIGVDAPERM